MNNKINELLKISATMSIIIFVFLKEFQNISSLSDSWDLLTQAVGYSAIITCIYEKFLWKFNPFIKIPKLKKEYDGTLKYKYNGKSSEKNIKIFISQTLTTISIIIKTDEITSKSITSELMEENNQYVIYYTYITQPKSEVSDENPIQNGTAKLLIDDIHSFRGTYWTSRKTTGDLYFENQNN